MLHPIEMFFHSTLRIGRIQFLLSAACLLTARVGIDALVANGLPRGLGTIAILTLGYSAICVLSMRLHDRGRSGWLALPIIGLFHYAWPITLQSYSMAGYAALGVLALVAIDLVTMPGQKGLNRHGPSPAARKATGSAFQ